jgi:glycosyltransferase involved in cell wall biosynthesis
MKPVIIIPAYQPDSRLLDLLEKLVQLGDSKIVIVDDGSDPACTSLFDRAEEYDDVQVLVHAQNKGKGAALRTGFRYVLEQGFPCRSVITADADGQHKAEDIAGVQAACVDNPSHLILGVRYFNGYVPLRSRLGNSLTRRLYALLFKQKLSDTQSGLRGIPVEALDKLIALKSERYSFELEMLLCFHKNKTPVLEIPISTVYEKSNSSSHFRPLFDSIQIYSTLIGWWLKNR